MRFTTTLGPSLVELVVDELVVKVRGGGGAGAGWLAAHLGAGFLAPPWCSWW